MLKFLKLLLSFAFVFGVFTQCSESEERTWRVTYIVDSNTLDVPIRVVGADPRSTYIVVKGHYENTITTDAGIVSMVARCDDPNVLITLQIFVNGKRKDVVSGNGRVTTREVRLR